MENNNFVIENSVLKAYIGSDTCVSIPEGVTKVGKNAFSGNNKINEVVFPQNSIKSIEAGAFASCKSIKKLMLPKGLLQIGDNAFTDCAALEYVFIPDSVVLIGEDLFGSNHSVIILGETGSEAEKYANANSPKLPFSTNVSAISAAKKAPERKAQSKTFDIFGEDVKCSSTLSFFHNALEYYEYRKDVLFERVIDALPLEINADFSKILNVQNFLNQEDLLLIERIEKYGFIINKGEIAVHTAEASISMIEATKAIAEFYCQAIKYQQSTIQDQAAQLQQAAENSVTGLSYGILGNSFDMAIYALDDFRARQKQRREAYAKAESRLASFKEKLTTNIQREYVKTVSEKIPVIRQLTDNYITGLRNAEIVKLVDVGVLDRKAVDAIDLEKSSELLQKALDAKNDDKAFLIAKALEKYPCNCAAIAYAVEQGLTCNGLDQLIDFVGLQEKVSQTITNNAENRHAECYEKAAASLSSAAYQNRINTLMNEEKVFSKEEIRNLLQIPIPSISSKLISATENPDISQEYTPEQYAKSKLYAILPEAQWDFYKKYDVFPLNGEKIPANELNTYTDLLSWFQSKIQVKEDKYIRACKMLESRKNLSEARDVFAQLKGYKNSEKKLASTRQILKKKNRKTAFASMITIIAIAVIAIIGTTIYSNLPSTQVKKFIEVCDECASDSISTPSIINKLEKAKLISSEYELTGINDKFWSEFQSKKDNIQILDYLQSITNINVTKYLGSEYVELVKAITESFLQYSGIEQNKITLTKVDGYYSDKDNQINTQCFQIDHDANINVNYYGDVIVYKINNTQYIAYKGYEFSSSYGGDEFTQELDSAFSIVVQNKETGDNIEYLFYGRYYDGELDEYRLVKLSDEPNLNSNLYYYNKAVNYYDGYVRDSNTYKLDKAEELFTILGDYRDSKEYLKKIEEVKIPTPN